MVSVGVHTVLFLLGDGSRGLALLRLGATLALLRLGLFLVVVALSLVGNLLAFAPCGLLRLDGSLTVAICGWDIGVLECLGGGLAGDGLEALSLCLWVVGFGCSIPVGLYGS